MTICGYVADTHTHTLFCGILMRLRSTAILQIENALLFDWVPLSAVRVSLAVHKGCVAAAACVRTSDASYKCILIVNEKYMEEIGNLSVIETSQKMKNGYRPSRTN